jgi:hypothetical protein
MFDLTISLGSILTIAVLIVSVTVYVVTGRNAGIAAAGVLDARLAFIEAQMENFGQEMEKLANVVIKQVEQSGRVDRVEDRQMAQGKRTDELQKALNDWTSVSGVYEMRHREIENRIVALERAR